MTEKTKPIEWDPNTKIGKFMLEWIVPNENDTKPEYVSKKILQITAPMLIGIGTLIGISMCSKNTDSSETKSDSSETIYTPRSDKAQNTFWEKNS